jgi:uncharacterized membrane protein YgcG
MATAKKKAPAKQAAPAKKTASANKPKPKEPPKPPDRQRPSTVPPLPGKGASPRNPRAMTTAQLDARLAQMQRDAKNSRLDSYTPRSAGRGLGGISGGRGNSGRGGSMRGGGGSMLGRGK